MTRRRREQRGSARHGVLAWLVGSILLGCASTQLTPDENHPASATAESIAVAPVGGALARDYEPRAQTSTGGASSSGSAHEHGSHGTGSHEEKPTTVGGATEAEEPPPSPNPNESASKWTCTMHPEIIRDKPGNCPICGMKLVPVQPKGSSGAKP